MIIATDEFDMSKIIQLKDNVEEMDKYIWSLVPVRYKHVDAIYRNTRYYINVCVLKSTTMSMEMKKELSAKLTKGLHVVGFMGTFITCGELESRISMKKVNKYYEGETL